MKVYSFCFFVGLSSLIEADPRLLSAQVFFRHGDRTPLTTIPTDPYQEAFWGVPWGSLTTEGMQQQLQSGLKLKARYVDQLKLINATYSPYEIYIQSALQDRCLQSAAAHFAGFYSDSQYHPNDNQWPQNWTPMAIHTNAEPDKEFEPGADCPRVDQLQQQRLARQEYLNYEQEHMALVEAYANGTGQPWTHLTDILQYTTTLYCERAHNLELLPFVTPQIYNESMMVLSTISDYFYGMAVLQVLQNDELIKLRSGILLRNLTNLFTENTDYKYYVYSVHDLTITSILYALGTTAKAQVLGDDQPGYAASLIFELWKMDDQSLGIKLLYANTAEEDLKEVTNAINGCQNQEYCPQQTVLRQLGKYFINDVNQECQAQ